MDVFFLLSFCPFFFQCLFPSSSSSFPFSSSFSSLYAVFSLLFSLIFLSLLPDSLKVTFEMRVTHTLRHKCRKSALCCRRHWWNSVDLNMSVLTLPISLLLGSKAKPIHLKLLLISLSGFFFLIPSLLFLAAF